MQEDEANLDLCQLIFGKSADIKSVGVVVEVKGGLDLNCGSLFLCTAGAQCKDHNQSKQHCNDFFHSQFSYVVF